VSAERHSCHCSFAAARRLVVMIVGSSDELVVVVVVVVVVVCSCVVRRPISVLTPSTAQTGLAWRLVPRTSRALPANRSAHPHTHTRTHTHTHTDRARYPTPPHHLPVPLLHREAEKRKQFSFVYRLFNA